MTDRQMVVLSEFVRIGGLLFPTDDEVRDRCKELTALKLMRPQACLEGMSPVTQPRLSVGYEVTAKGRTVAAAGAGPAKGAGEG